MQRKMVNIRINPVLWHDVKVLAMIKGKTLQDFIEDLLRSEVNGKRQKT